MSRFTRNTALVLTLTPLFVLVACATQPEPRPEIIVLPPQPVNTCAPVSALQRMVIPAETKVFYAITMIDNPPYEPIERKEKQTRIIKPAQIIYVDSQGREVLDICENVQTGPVGPAAGAVITGDPS